MRLVDASDAVKRCFLDLSSTLRYFGFEYKLQAFKEFVKVNEKKQQRPSLRQKLKGLQKIVAQNKNKERSREKNKDRGQSL